MEYKEKSKTHKQAYLIVAHNQYELLKKLLAMIDNKNNDIYIHLDKKFKECNVAELKKCVKYSKIIFIKRTVIGWGGYSQVALTVKMLEIVNRNLKYDYYHLISGVDLPLKDANYIYDFFDKSNGIEYIAYDNNIYDTKYDERIKYYYFFQEYARNNKVSRKLNSLIVNIQKLLKVNRIKNINFKLQKGANWFSITNSLVEYILQQKEWIKKYFTYSCCADEMFIQTIVENSKFKDNVYKNGINQGNLRLIDWTRGKPYTWKKENKDELLNSEFMWARKFNMDIDREIIDIIWNKTVLKNK